MNKHQATLTTLANALYSILIIGLCLFIGKVIANYLGGLPASLYGMIFFTFLLQHRYADAVRIKTTIDWIIRNMGVCFVPAGVGIINHFELIKQHGFAMISIIFITTFLLMTLVGLAYQKKINLLQPTIITNKN